MVGCCRGERKRQTLRLDEDEYGGLCADKIEGCAHDEMQCQ